MTGQPTPAKSSVSTLPISSGALMRMIRERAQNKSNVNISDHAFDRVRERSGVVEITVEDVYRVLQLGEIEGNPVEGKNAGEWKAVVAFRPKGGRTIGVATVVLTGGNELFVTTVMWRDA